MHSLYTYCLIAQTACTQSLKADLAFDGFPTSTELESDGGYTTEEEDSELDELYESFYCLEEILNQKKLSDDLKEEALALVKEIRWERCEKVQEEAYKALMESRHYYQKDSESFISSRCQDLQLREEQKRRVHKSIRMHFPNS